MPSTFVSAALLVCSSMLRLGLPHVSVLSKVAPSCPHTISPTCRCRYSFSHIHMFVCIFRLICYITTDLFHSISTSSRKCLPSRPLLSTKHAVCVLLCYCVSLPDVLCWFSRYIEQENFDISEEDPGEEETDTHQGNAIQHNTIHPPNNVIIAVSHSSSSSAAPPPPTPLSLTLRMKRMSAGLCEVLDDFGLLSFIAMNIQDGEVMHR
jgi:hypothetical protein